MKTIAWFGLRSIALCLLAAHCYALPSDPPEVTNPNAATAARPLPDCHVGAYLLSDGSIVDIAPRVDTLRWLRFDGTTGVLHKTPTGTWTSTAGWSDRVDGKSASFGECGTGTIEFDGAHGKRIAFDMREATDRKSVV